MSFNELGNLPLRHEEHEDFKVEPVFSASLWLVTFFQGTGLFS